ncbi:hypothetical protein HanPI659440_Chr07g0252911 [Helianthus annuus]|nr:hypothetical protein HanPI659440_Chr07g0252911 [Helianthus annuus]
MKKQVEEIPAAKIEKEEVVGKMPIKCENCDIVRRHNNKLIHNMNRLQESYDVLNKSMNRYTKSSEEQTVVMKTLRGVFMTKQKVLNQYIEKCAELEQKLESQRIETKRVDRVLKSYSHASYVIDRIYPIVEGMEAFAEETPEKKTGKKQSVNYTRCPPPLEENYSPRNPNFERVKNATNLKWESEPTSHELPDNKDVTFTASYTDQQSQLMKKVVDHVLDKDETEESTSEPKPDTSSPKVKKDKRVYNEEFLLSNNNLNDEIFKVAYTLNDSDKLFSD